jgi:hypothetical protein
VETTLRKSCRATAVNRISANRSCTDFTKGEYKAKEYFCDLLCFVCEVGSSAERDVSFPPVGLASFGSHPPA